MNFIFNKKMRLIAEIILGVLGVTMLIYGFCLFIDDISYQEPKEEVDTITLAEAKKIILQALEVGGIEDNRSLWLSLGVSEFTIVNEQINAVTEVSQKVTTSGNIRNAGDLYRGYIQSYDAYTDRNEAIFYTSDKSYYQNNDGSVTETSFNPHIFDYQVAIFSDNYFQKLYKNTVKKMVNEQGFTLRLSFTPLRYLALQSNLSEQEVHESFLAQIAALNPSEDVDDADEEAKKKRQEMSELQKIYEDAYYEILSQDFYVDIYFLTPDLIKSVDFEIVQIQSGKVPVTQYNLGCYYVKNRVSIARNYDEIKDPEWVTDYLEKQAA